MREYTDCYVAFMDLLGFKALLSDKEKSCEDIASVFDEISKRYDLRENEIPMIDISNIHFKVTVDENKVIAIEFRNGKRIAYKEENNAEE